MAGVAMAGVATVGAVAPATPMAASPAGASGTVGCSAVVASVSWVRKARRRNSHWTAVGRSAGSAAVMSASSPASGVSAPAHVSSTRPRASTSVAASSADASSSAPPKPVRCGLSSLSSRMFDAVTFRCTTPWSCVWASASVSVMPMSTAVASGSGPSDRCAARLPPSTKCVTRHGRPSSVPMLKIETRPGWLSLASAWASVSKRCRANGSAGCRSSFTATVRSSRWSRARWTSDVAPEPSGPCRVIRLSSGGSSGSAAGTGATGMSVIAASSVPLRPSPDGCPPRPGRNHPDFVTVAARNGSWSAGMAVLPAIPSAPACPSG